MPIPRISPWVDRDELRRRGAVIVWEDGQIDAAALAQLRTDYPGLKVQAPLTLPRQTFVARGSAPAGARALRHRAAAAIAVAGQAAATASPSISTLRSGPANPAITR